MTQKNKIKEKQKSKGEPKERWYHTLNPETKHSIFAVVSLVLAIFFTMAAFGQAGVIGKTAFKVLDFLFGTGFFLLPIVFFLASAFLVFSIKTNFLSHTIIGGSLFLLSSLGLMDVIKGNRIGGFIGYVVALPLIKLFDTWVSAIILIALLIISFLIMLNTTISFSFLNFFKKEKDEDGNEKDKKKNNKDIDDATDAAIAKTKNADAKTGKDKNGLVESIKGILPTGKTEKDDKKDGSKITIEPRKIKQIDFTPPPLELLSEDKGKPSSGDIKANANIIKRTLSNFGIEVEMGEINIGPSVTQYTLRPAEGIKLSRIVGLQSDLALSLAAHPLRIEAPIPGRALVGIEAPNTSKTLLGLANLFSDDAFKNSADTLLIALGKDVTGKNHFASLAKMPHLLIAGATGSGKSIYIHVLITSLLYRNSPESLRFIMIDPKRVELTSYNKIPHLLTPVITNVKKAIMSLKWACQEMDRRYDELAKVGVRNIASYHEKMGGYNSMPYIVIVIDELADMMVTYPKEMEAAIVRLAQMSRAVGIHLVVSTQRPSVEVITGLIKANIPCRIALQVASQIDSRTILDNSGAEKLLGAGDMLFLSGNTSSKPRRIQGPFISEKEVKRVVDYLAEEYQDLILDTQEIPEDKLNSNGNNSSASSSDFGERQQSPLNIGGVDVDERSLGGFGGESGGDDDDDDLYEQAREIVIQAGKASTSYLQRRLKVGYARAARLIDMLEEHGVVSPGDGAKPRTVLISGGEGNMDNNNNSGKDDGLPDDFQEENKVDF